MRSAEAKASARKRWYEKWKGRFQADPCVLEPGCLDVRALCKIKRVSGRSIARHLGWGRNTWERVVSLQRGIWPHERKYIARCLRVHPPEALRLRLRIQDGKGVEDFMRTLERLEDAEREREAGGNLWGEAGATGRGSRTH